jgi:hypothetical protein
MASQIDVHVIDLEQKRSDTVVMVIVKAGSRLRFVLPVTSKLLMHQDPTLYTNYPVVQLDDTSGEAPKFERTKYSPVPAYVPTTTTTDT